MSSNNQKSKVDPTAVWGNTVGNETSEELHPYRGKAPKNYRRTDEKIKEDICETIIRDGRFDPSQISVEVVQGKVILEGKVDHKEAPEHFKNLSQRTQGVIEVEARLEVQSPSDKVDADPTPESDRKLDIR